MPKSTFIEKMTTALINAYYSLTWLNWPKFLDKGATVFELTGVIFDQGRDIAPKVILIKKRHVLVKLIFEFEYRGVAVNVSCQQHKTVIMKTDLLTLKERGVVIGIVSKIISIVCNNRFTPPSPIDVSVEGV